MKMKILIAFVALLHQSTVELSRGHQLNPKQEDSKPKPLSRDYSSNNIIHRDVGGVVKFQCKIKPSRAQLQVRWLKNGKELMLRKHPHFRITKKKAYNKPHLFAKLVFNAEQNDSGKYSCIQGMNGTWTTVKTWQLHVLEAELTGESRRIRNAEDCGESPVSVEDGFDLSCYYGGPYMDCKSFPGKPRTVRVYQILENETSDVWQPAIVVEWEHPEFGFKDLWGYGITLLGLRGHANHQSCYQINSKSRSSSGKPIKRMVFHNGQGEVLFGAEYHIRLESLPNNNRNYVEKQLIIKGYCQWPQYEAEPECYAVTNLTADFTFVNSSFGWRINVTWDKHLKHFGYTSTYGIALSSYPLLHAFYAAEQINATQNVAVFRVPPQTKCTNISISVKGINSDRSETKPARFRLPSVGNCPTPAPPLTRVVEGEGDSRTLKIAVIVGSVLMALLVVALFFVYRTFYKPIVVKLPPVSPPTAASGDAELILQEQAKRRVYIMHSNCCEACNWAVIQFGNVLRNTERIDVRLDLWDTLDILPNKPLYYEKQIIESDCVVVMADSAMKDCACSPDVLPRSTDKNVDTRFQLNLIRGEITSKPGTRKYVPVFMSFNSTKKDIPDFLSSRLSHALPEEIDRVVFHLLNIERIQPRRRRMIAVIGGNDHPYDEAKKRFEEAVDSATRNHLQLEHKSDYGIEMSTVNSRYDSKSC